MTVFEFIYLLSYIVFVFIDILSLLAFEVYIIFELVYYLRIYSLSKTNSGNQRIFYSFSARIGV